ncbi:5-oxoprolinase subunit C family protein [Bacillus alkalisoli]|uniref:5-oxoprolinase subunit C family protein n=1 Tax=Bacillus alkalisoli TaxID=2011008 RepID=UPI000C23D355|nr:biotin-dependent carboxyltransferase family protein [Bacillus alkalisoli]
MKPIFQVLKTGLVTSFQDKGRIGYQAFGVVTSGAMDMFSFEIANSLVGNQPNEACIEMAIVGPSLTVVSEEEVSIAVTGTNLGFSINGKIAPMWKAIKVSKGDKLSFPGSRDGMFAYIALRGGFAVPSLLGSKSYYGKAKLGTAILQGDFLFGQNPSTCRTRGLLSYSVPTFSKQVTARVILGPHDGDFTEESLRQFFSQPFKVLQCDRMGSRLEGATPLRVHDGADVLSDAIPLGGIQVPQGGQPIVLLADRQTTGGYRRIGTVIKADLPKLVQVPVGGTVVFQKVTLEEAYKALLHQQAYINVINHSSHN